MNRAVSFSTILLNIPIGLWQQDIAKDRAGIAHRNILSDIKIGRESPNHRPS